MPLFLHEAIDSPKALDRVLSEKPREDEHLDFKAMFWRHNKDRRKAQEEAAKDVAAFLNGLGGTILVGVSEDGEGRAAELHEGHSNRGLRETLLDWLRGLLVPESSAGVIHVAEIVSVAGGERREVLAVNVEPWPHGPVAVRVGDDRQSYRFPVRRGRETRFMAWEEIVSRNDAAQRRMHLKLKALAGPNKRLVLTTPVGVRMAGRSGPVVVPPREGHGWLWDTINEDHVILQLDCQHIAEHVGREMHLERFPAEERPKTEFLGFPVDVLQADLLQLKLISRSPKA